MDREPLTRPGPGRPGVGVEHKGMLRTVLIGGPAGGEVDPAASPGKLRLGYLANLRWHAVCGQGVAIALATAWLELPLPWRTLTLLVALLAFSNVLLLVLVGKGALESDRAVAATLYFDTALLTAELYLTGGTSNPFSSLYLIQIALAAILLDRGGTARLTVFSLLCYGGLYFRAAPLPPVPRWADWVAFVLVAVVLGAFVAKLAQALREQHRALTQRERSAARTDKLVALGTLAAGVAHELNTPLGSIAVAAGELMHLVPAGQGEAREEVRAIRVEIERCRSILARLSSRAGRSVGEAPGPTTIATVLGSLGRRIPEPRLQLKVQREGEFEAPVSALEEVLANLVTNALHATGSRPTPVVIEAGLAEQRVWFQVRDQGSGVSEPLMARIGEPFFTTKPAGEGMGLGLFLGRSFAEACGGSLVFESESGRGSVVTLELPRRLCAPA